VLYLSLLGRGVTMDTYGSTCTSYI